MLNGIGAGPAESIQPAVIADIFFLHDRGFWNTLYWVAYMGSLMVGGVSPILSLLEASGIDIIVDCQRHHESAPGMAKLLVVQHWAHRSLTDHGRLYVSRDQVASIASR